MVAVVKLDTKVDRSVQGNLAWLEPAHEPVLAGGGGGAPPPPHNASTFRSRTWSRPSLSKFSLFEKTTERVSLWLQVCRRSTRAKRCSCRSARPSRCSSCSSSSTRFRWSSPSALPVSPFFRCCIWILVARRRTCAWEKSHVEKSSCS